MDSEEIIKKLTEFSIPEYFPALRILFASKDSMPQFPDETGTLHHTIIQFNHEPDIESIEAINLAFRKWQEMLEFALQQTNMAELQRKFYNVFSSAINSPFAIAMNVVGTETAAGYASSLLHLCMSKFKDQNELFKNPEIIRQLSHPKLEIITPISQISVCGACHNFEILLSTYPKRDTTCSKCSRDVLTARIFKLNDDYEVHKTRNKDLPLFATHYISRKTSNNQAICSFKISNRDNSSIEGDIDVYVPLTKTGMECKLYSSSDPQGGIFEGKKGEIATDFIKFGKFGIRRFIALTNLSESKAEELQKSLEKKLQAEGIHYDLIRIGYNSVKDLLSILDNEVSEIRKSHN